MKQETMLDKIRKSAEHVPTPKGLEPEHILETAARKPVRTRPWVRYSAVAAMLAAVVLTAHQGFRAGWFHEGTEAPETAAETAVASGDLAPSAAESGSGKEQYIAKSYDDLYKQIQTIAKAETELPMTRGLMAAPAKEEADIAAAPAMLSAPSGQGGAGAINSSLDGADILKADDNYLYIVSAEAGSVRIVQTQEEGPAEVSVIQNPVQEGEQQTIIGLYLYENRLSVIRDLVKSYTMDSQMEEIPDSEDGQAGEAAAEEIESEVWESRTTLLDTYDITDRANPVLMGTTEQDGSYKSSRMEEGIIYLFTEQEIDPGAEAGEKSRYIPVVNGTLLLPEDIYVPDVVTEPLYLIISSIDMGQPGAVLDAKAVLSGGQQFYISADYIYAGNSKYNYEAHQYEYTELLKLGYQNGLISYKAHALIDGYLDSRFAMDEYEGNLRLISTSALSGGGAVDSLYILDENLAVIGSSTDLSPGDQIYATRFIGQRGYYMTFQNAEVFYALDLSQPENPKKLGRIKSGKFPEYLHPFGSTETRLLGIERQDEGITEGMGMSGLKIAVYDISDPVAVNEVHSMEEPSYDYSNAWYQPQSVSISKENDLIGFSVEQYGEQPQSLQQKYVVYSYSDKNGFTKRLDYAYDDGGSYVTRGVKSGASFYLVSPYGITVFSTADFQVTGQLNF